MKKNITKILLIITVAFSALSTIYAEEVTKTVKIDHKTIDGSKTPVKFPTTFHVKKTSGGKYTYCLTYNKKVPDNTNYELSQQLNNYGTNYILKEAYNAKNDSEYFIYQTALWIYLMDIGKMDNSNTINTFKKTLSSSNSSSAKKIKELVSEAKKQKSFDNSEPTIKITDAEVTFSLDSEKKYYVSSSFKVTSSENDYKLELVNAKEGSKYEIKNGLVTIYIPASNVQGDLSFELKATTSKTIYKSYRYRKSNEYQKMSLTYKETKNASDVRKFNISSSKVLISKQDATTSKELPGAHLVVKNEYGKVEAEWTSTDKPYEIALNPGKYTLTETIAPNGYVLSTEEITFKVKNDGSTTQVVMKNSREEKKVNNVEISKQDATSGKELEGAHLVVKNEDGEIIDEWTSTNTPHIIKDIKAGKYTLTETIAPDGYVLSTEEITFTVKSDGTTTKVVMKNSPKETPKEDVPVPSTGTHKNPISAVAGTLVLLAGSVLVTKSIIKKNEK